VDHLQPRGEMHEQAINQRPRLLDRLPVVILAPRLRAAACRSRPWARWCCRWCVRAQGPEGDPTATRSRNAAVASRQRPAPGGQGFPRRRVRHAPAAAHPLRGALERPGKASRGEVRPRGRARRPPVAGTLPVGRTMDVAELLGPWCVPCKEEIPRLLSWEQKLNAAGSPSRSRSFARRRRAAAPRVPGGAAPDRVARDLLARRSRSAQGVAREGGGRERSRAASSTC
jgi:hypothetical protein